MSEYYYSFKEKGFFWQPDTESDNYPDDLIPLTDEYYRELMQGRWTENISSTGKEARYWLSIANIRLKSWLHRLKPEKRNFLLRQSQLLRHWRGR